MNVRRALRTPVHSAPSARNAVPCPAQLNCRRAGRPSGPSCAPVAACARRFVRRLQTPSSSCPLRIDRVLDHRDEAGLCLRVVVAVGRGLPNQRGEAALRSPPSNLLYWVFLSHAGSSLHTLRQSGDAKPSPLNATSAGKCADRAGNLTCAIADFSAHPSYLYRGRAAD